MQRRRPEGGLIPHGILLLPNGLELLIFGRHVEGDVEQDSHFWTT